MCEGVQTHPKRLSRCYTQGYAHKHSAVVLHRPLCNVCTRLQMHSAPGLSPLPVIGAPCCCWRLKRRAFPLPQASRVKTRGDGRRLKTPERRDGKAAFLQRSIPLPPFLAAAGRQIRLTAVRNGSPQQPLHVVDVVQDNTVGRSPPVPRAMGRGVAGMQRTWQQAVVAYSQQRESDVLGQGCLSGCCASPEHGVRGTKDHHKPASSPNWSDDLVALCQLCASAMRSPL